jgi:hypothetical protein
MATHYCGGEAVESKLMLVRHNLDCGMPNMEQGCEEEIPDEQQLSPKPCCQNDYQTFHSDDTFKPQVLEVSPNLVFLAAFVQSFILPTRYTPNTLGQFTDYTRPLPEQDIQVLFQSFLI